MGQSRLAAAGRRIDASSGCRPSCPRRLAAALLSACWTSLWCRRGRASAAATPAAPAARVPRTWWRGFDAVSATRRAAAAEASRGIGKLREPHRCIKHNHDATNSHSVRIASACALSTTTAPRPVTTAAAPGDHDVYYARREARRRKARPSGSCARRAATWPTSGSTAIKFLSDAERESRDRHRVVIAVLARLRRRRRHHVLGHPHDPTSSWCGVRRRKRKRTPNRQTPAEKCRASGPVRGRRQEVRSFIPIAVRGPNFEEPAEGDGGQDDARRFCRRAVDVVRVRVRGRLDAPLPEHQGDDARRPGDGASLFG